MLAASQVFATALDTYFQLTIMLMILMVGVTAFAHFQPFLDDLLQRMQVRLYIYVHSHMHAFSHMWVQSHVGSVTCGF